MIRDFNFNVSSVLRKMGLVCNVCHQNAKLRSMLNVQEDLTIAWKLKGKKAVKIRVIGCSVRSIDLLRL